MSQAFAGCATPVGDEGASGDLQGCCTDCKGASLALAAASGRTILAILALYWACDALNVFNPFANLVALQYPLGTRDPADDVPRYGKGLGDLPFLAFYVVVFSCFRQSAIRYIIHPLALFGGIRGERKLERFTEQGYAFLYWSLSSLAGLVSSSH